MAAGLKAGTAYVDVLPRVSAGFGNKIESDMKGEAESAGKNTGSALGGALGGAAVLAAGALGVKLFKGFMDEAHESQAVAAQTAAVIKSTGGAAHVTAADIDTLSNAISKKVGIDDEAIAKSANLLLTFTDVRNEVGKGNDIFNQATKTVTDMSVALGQDAKSSAIQLGKAHNDPIAGITALSRVGVSFTAQQKEQIKVLVEHGDKLGAQKIILAELSKEFGGSAEAQATAGKKLQVVWGNIEEQAGTFLLPIIAAVENALAVAIPKAISMAGDAFDFISRHIDIIAPVIGGLAVAIAIPLVGAFISWAVAAAAAAVATIAAAAPVILVTLAIAALAAGIIYAYTHFQIFHDIVNAVADVFMLVFKVAIDVVKFEIGLLVDIVKLISRVIGDVITIVVDLFHGDWKGAWEAFKDIPLAIIGFFQKEVGRIIDLVVGIFRDMPGRLKAIGGDIFGFLREAFKAAVNFIIRGWNSLEFKVPGFDAGPIHVGGFTLGVPDIPLLATGGRVIGSGLAVVGEQGPEIVRLPAGAEVIPNGGGKTYQLVLNGVTNGEVDVREQFRRMELLTL